MYIAKEISILDYHSNIPKSLVLNLIKNSKFNDEGVYELSLSPNSIVQETGPFMIPPQRWTDSFSRFDSLHIKCKIENV